MKGSPPQGGADTAKFVSALMLSLPDADLGGTRDRVPFG